MWSALRPFTSSGASGGSWAGVVSAPWVGPSSGMKPRSGNGRKSAGWRLKKKPKKKANHRLRRRKWTERASPPHAYLGSQRDKRRCCSITSLEDLSVIAGILFGIFTSGSFPEPFAARRSSSFLLICYATFRVNCSSFGTACPRIAAVPSGISCANGGTHLVRISSAYAPELNPTEYIWGHLKQMRLLISAPRTLAS